MTTTLPTSRPSLTYREIIDQCGISRSTLKRRAAAGDFPNQYQENPSDPRSPWRIPVTDLLAVGLNPAKPAPPDPVAETPLEERTRTRTVTETQWDDLQAELAQLRAEARVHENRVNEIADPLRDLIEEKDTRIHEYQKQIEATTAASREAAAAAAAAAEELVDLRDLESRGWWGRRTAKKIREARNQ